MQSLEMYLMWILPRILLILCKRSVSEAAGPSVKRLERAADSTELSDNQGDGTDTEILLQQAPELVQLLGQLMILSTANVDLKLTRPHNGWQYVNQPDSFLATLTQVNQEAVSAVMNSTNRMRTVQGYMQILTIEVQTVLQLLSLGNDSVQMQHLPEFLAKISKHENEVAEDAHLAEQAVELVTLLIGEVIVSATADRDVVSKAIFADKENAQKQEEKLTQQSGERIGKYTRIKNVFECLSDEYEATVVQSLSTETSSLRKKFLYSGKTIFGYSLLSADNENRLDQKILNHLYTMQYQAVASASQLLNGTGEQGNNSELVPASQLLAQANVMPRVAFKLLKLLNLPSDDGKKAKEAFDIVVALIERSTSILNSSADGASVSSIIQELNAQTDSLRRYAVTEQSWNVALGTDASNDLSEKIKVNANYVRIKFEKGNLEASKEVLLKQQVNVKITMEKLTKITSETSNTTNILDLLIEGINILTETRMRWTNLSHYIRRVAAESVVAARILSTELKDNVQRLQTEMSQKQTLMVDFCRDALQQSLVRLNNQLLIVTKMASTYVEHSDKFILPKLPATNQFATIKTDEERQNAMSKLEQEANEMKQEIDATMTKRIDELQQKLENELTKAQHLVEKTGKVTNEETKEIEESLKMVLPPAASVEN